MEVELIPEGLSENSLKLILVNGSLDTLPSLSKFLKSGGTISGYRCRIIAREK